MMPKGELRTDTIALLRFGHSKRHPRTRGCDRRGQIPNMTSIDRKRDDSTVVDIGTSIVRMV